MTCKIFRSGALRMLSKSESQKYAAYRLKDDYYSKLMFEASLPGIDHGNIGIIAGFDRLVIIGGSSRLDNC